jgi:hypothetical protein
MSAVMTQEDLVTFYGKIRIAALKAGEADAGGIPHFQINTRYINNTRQIVRAKHRSNLEMCFPAVPVRSQHAHDEMFIVRKELVVSITCIEAMRSYFLNLPEDASVTPELECFRKAYLQVFENVFRFNQTRELRCVVEHMFTEQDLVAHGGLFYHDELDMLFKFGEAPFDMAHPHSPAGRQQSVEEQALQLRDEHGFIFWVEIIDNLEKYGERFIPICNQVYKIVPKKDKNRPDGLYIVSSKPTTGRLAPTEVSTRHYPMEDIEKELGIYASYELAKSNGDVAGARKRELQEREHEFLRQKQEWSETELRYKREAADRDRAIKDAEAERNRLQVSMDELRDRQAHLMKMQEMQTKERMEQRSAERKDASEMIKFLPVILSAVGTILMAWSTFRGK